MKVNLCVCGQECCPGVFFSSKYSHGRLSTKDCSIDLSDLLCCSFRLKLVCKRFVLMQNFVKDTFKKLFLIYNLFRYYALLLEVFLTQINNL